MYTIERSAYTMNWYIRRTHSDQYFAGWNADNSPRFGSANESKPFATRKDAKCQALFLK